MIAAKRCRALGAGGVSSVAAGGDVVSLLVPASANGSTDGAGSVGALPAGVVIPAPAAAAQPSRLSSRIPDSRDLRIGVRIPADAMG